MKVVVTLPYNEKSKHDLEDKIATFHATLILEAIDKLEVNEPNKKDILSKIISKFKKQN